MVDVFWTSYAVFAGSALAFSGLAAGLALARGRLSWPALSERGRGISPLARR